MNLMVPVFTCGVAALADRDLPAQKPIASKTTAVTP
jgi:hypothetical protein